MDHNDNNPICFPSTIEQCIYEDHPLNVEITRANCSDPDITIIGSGADTDVVYGFSGGNINELFAIDLVSCQLVHACILYALMLRQLESFHWLNQWTEKL